MKVFISYRRVDGAWPARELYRALTAALPPERVFMDVDAIRIGEDFVSRLETWVRECDVLLALIGPGWIDVLDPRTGRRRLDDPADFVRIEIAEALRRDIPVVPLLLDGAPPPDAARLPEDIRMLARRQAEHIEHRTAGADIARLMRKLGLPAPGEPPADPSAVPSADPPEPAPTSPPPTASNARLFGFGVRDDDEELLQRAIALVRRERRASTSVVQRRLQIGYNHAARIIDAMESAGLISAADRVGKRVVLIPPEDGS